MKNVLIINTHQFYEGISSGSLNQTLVDTIKVDMEQRGYSVQLTDIEQGYDIEAEVCKHVWADIIILQSPVYWFGTPWIYKKYVDEVFTAGIAGQRLLVDDRRTREDPTKQYGTGGKMHGKQYMLSLTWNAPKEAFGNDDQVLFAGKTMDDVFVNNSANYKFCGAEVLPSFSSFNVIKQADVEGDLAKLREHLAAVI
ncbi:NAD(P)H-dependent oxidoreductase [Aquirhabdus sp.]|uniref:NAD(P)H-dependent oxidoreductase n=1 Tax=Aquirhabdus sp. TaxID=2824160 RepID=UPI00396CFF89